MLSSIALGSIFAMVVASWNTMKQVFTHLSSILVVSCSISYTYAESLKLWLESGGKLLPSGRKIAIFSCKRTGLHEWKYLVYLENIDVNIYIGTYGIVFITRSNGNLKISGIRSLLNINQMLRDMVLRANRDPKYATDFYIRNCIGETRYREFNLNSNKGSSESIQGSSIVDEEGVFSVYNSSVSLVDDLYPLYKEKSSITMMLDDSVKDHIDIIQSWKSMRNWYIDRGIPWRHGFLLYGPPGTGKSTLVRQLGQYLDIRVIIFHLATMDDKEFLNFMAGINSVDTPAIILFEDFDTIFKGREPVDPTHKLSFNTILNAMSGVENQDGKIYIITTNDISSIDPAIGITVEGSSVSTRPGRIDYCIYMGNISRDNRIAMGTKILKDWPEDIIDLVDKHTDVTPAQFQALCIEHAFHKIRSSEHA